MKRETAAERAIEEAWAFWLSQHPVSVPEIIEDAVAKSFRSWLNAHSDEIVEAIAKRARQ